jgi:hypothetical protein
MGVLLLQGRRDEFGIEHSSLSRDDVIRDRQTHV